MQLRPILDIDGMFYGQWMSTPTLSPQYEETDGESEGDFKVNSAKIFSVPVIHTFQWLCSLCMEQAH